MAQKKLYRALSLAVMIAVLTVIFALSAFAEIAGGNGVITGLDNGSYVAAPVTLNSNGDGYTVGEYTAVDSTTAGLAGLYDVRLADDETEGLVNLVYVNGSFTERAQLGTFDTETGNAIYNGSATFMPGTWTNSNSGYPLNANNSYYVRAHQWLGSTTKSAQLFTLEKPRSVALEYFKDNTSLEALTVDLDTYYSQYYVTETTGEGEEQVVTITDTLSETGSALKESLTAEYKETIENFNFKYAFDSSEIISVSEVGSIQFAMHSDAGSDNYTIKGRKVIFYVMDSTGAVTPYTWENNTTNTYFRYWNTLTPVKFTADPKTIEGFPAEDAWVVGVEIYPFATVDMTTHSWNLNGTTTNKTLKAMQAAPVHRLNIYLDAYDIVVPELPAPTGLYVDGNEVKGLDIDSSYTLTPYTLAGLVTEDAITLEAGNTSCAGLTAGIWSVVATSDYGVTEPAYVYVDGLYSDRTDLFVEDETNSMPTTYLGSTTGFVAGSVSFPTAYASRNADYNVQLTTVNGSYEYLSGSAPADDAALALHKAEFETKAAELRAFKISYALTPAEIVSVSDLNTFAWYFNGHYNCFKYNNLASKFVAYIMTSDGTVVPYEYNHATHNFGSASDSWAKGWNYLAKQTVNFAEQTSANGTWSTALPAEGYLVGFEVYPFAGMDTYENVVYGGTARTQKKVDIAFVFDKTNYSIDKPVYSAPEGLYVEDGVVKGLDADASYIAYPYTINGADAENAEELGSGNTSIAGLAAGLWAITRAGDDNFSESAPAYVYVEGLYSDRVAIGTIETGATIPNNFTITADTKWTLGSFGVASGNNTGGHAATETVYTFYTTGGGLAKDSAIVEAVMDAKVALDAGTGTADAFLAAKQALVNVMSPVVSLNYAYAQDEIIPVAEFNSLAFTLAKPQGNIYQIKPTVVLHTVNTEGEAKTYTWSASAATNMGVKHVADFTEILPDTLDEYVTGFEIKPWGAMTAEEATLQTYEYTTSNTYLNNQLHFKTSIYFTEYNIDKPVHSAPEGLYVEDGVVKGLDADASYIAYPYTVNGADAENAEELGSGNTSIAGLAAGLWAITRAGDDNFSESAPALVYIEGTVAGRTNIANSTLNADGVKVPVYASGKDWVEGSFTGGLAGVSTSRPDEWYGLLQATIHMGTLRPLQTAETPDEEAIAAEKARLEDSAETIHLKYAYESEEIIPAIDLKNFVFGIRKAQDQANNNRIKPKVVFHLVDANGTASTATWTSTEYIAIDDSSATANQSNNKEFALDAETLASVLPQVDDKWIVGFEIYPWTDADFSDLNATGQYGENIFYNIYYNEYEVEVAPAPTPTGLYVEGNVVKGLDANYSYTLTPYTIAGLVTEKAITLEAGNTSCTNLTAGIWAVTAADAYHGGSAPAYVYVEGTYADKRNIGTFTEGSNVPASLNAAKYEIPAWTRGTFVASYSNGLMSVASDNVYSYNLYAISKEYNEELWNLIESEGDSTAARETVANRLESIAVRYALDSDEIIPVEDFKSLAYNITLSQTRLGFYYDSAVIISVLGTDGNVTEYTWTNGAARQATYGAGTSFVADFTKFGLTDGYVVGIDIRPFYSVDPASIYNYTNATTFYSSNIIIKIDFTSTGYVIAKPAADAPEGLTLVDGKVTGLDADRTYAYAPFTVNGADYASAQTLTADTALATGLWAVYFPETDESAASDVVILYVPGSYSDRANIFDYDSTNSSNLYAKDDTNSLFVPGTILLPSSVISRGGSAYAVSFGYSSLTSKFNAEGITEEEKKALFDANITQYQTYRYAYGFNSDEIVPISEVKSYTWALAQRYMPFGYTDLVSKFVAHIADENGNITEYEYLHAPKNFTSGYSGDNINTGDLAANATYNKIVDFTQTTSDNGTWTTALPAEGYLVGFEIIPLWGMTDYSNVVSTCTTNWLTSVQAYVYNNTANYLITKPEVDKPTGLAVVGNKVTGLDANKTYAYAPYTVDGVDYTSAQTLTADTTLATGLWAVYFPETDESAASDVVILYVPGSYSGRQTIGTFTEDSATPLYALSKTDIFQKGTFVGYGNFYSVEATDTYFKFYEISAGLGGTIQQNADTTEDAALKAQYMNELLTQMKTVHFTYQYADDEILAAKELKQIKFNFTTVQGKLWNYRPSVVFYVTDKDGNITEYTWNAESKIYGITSSPITLDTTTVLPQTADEYVLGFKILPWGAATLEDIVFRSDVGYNNQQFYIYFYFDSASYVLDKTTVEAPTGLAVSGNKVTGLDADKTYAAAPYTINGVNYDAVISLDADTELTAGMWAVYHPETTNSAASDYVLLYVLGTYAERANIFDVDTDGFNLYATDATNSVFVPGTIVLPSSVITKGNSTKAVSFGYTSFTSDFNAEGITEEERKALFDANIEQYKAFRYAYAFNADEISPVSELVSYTWGLAERYMAFGYNGLVSKFVAHIMDAEGNITEYEYLHAPKDLKTGYPGDNMADKDLAASETYSKTVDFMNKESEFGTWTTELPTEGYLVAFEIFPLYGMDDYANVDGLGTTSTSTAKQQISIYVYNDSADFVLIPDPKPSYINLVLEGQIGIKFTVEDVTENDVLSFANFSAGKYAAPEFVLDGTTATAILYVAPKDASDLVVTGDIVLNGYPMVRDFEVSVPGYVEDNKDSEGFEEVKPLLEAIDAYCNYADNYFNKEATALEDVALTTADKEELAKPIKAKRQGDLKSAGLEFNSTSLILEETVTIRHYFKVTDADKFATAGAHNLMKYSDDIYYIDVENIAAHELSTAMEAHIIGGSAEMTISFSVVDYAKLTWSDESDVKLANLAKSLYKYSVEADAYKAATAE